MKIYFGDVEIVQLWLLFWRIEILFQEHAWQHITMSIHILFVSICMLFVCMYMYHACGCIWRTEESLLRKSQSLLILLICFWELTSHSERPAGTHWATSPVTVYSSHIGEIDLYQFLLKIFLTMSPNQIFWWCVSG